MHPAPTWGTIPFQPQAYGQITGRGEVRVDIFGPIAYSVSDWMFVASIAHLM